MSGQHELVHPAAVGPDVAHRPGDQGGHADVPLAVHRERVEHLVAAEPGDHGALLAAVRAVRRLDLAGPGELEGPAARGRGLDHVERLLVGREADAVGPLEREDRLLDRRAVRLGVVDDAAVAVALARLAQIGEPEPARPVEHQVVRPAQALAVAAVVERVELARLRIHHLDAAGHVVVGLGHREELARAVHELEAAVVGHVHLAARAHRGAVRAAAERGDHVDLPVRRHARERAALDLDQDDGAVRHRHRTLGEPQSRGDLLDRGLVGGHQDCTCRMSSAQRSSTGSTSSAFADGRLKMSRATPASR